LEIKKEKERRWKKERERDERRKSAPSSRRAGRAERGKVARDWAGEGMYSWVECARLVGGVVGLGSRESSSASGEVVLPVRCGTRSAAFRQCLVDVSLVCMCALARDNCRFRASVFGVVFRAPVVRYAVGSKGYGFYLSIYSSLTRVCARARARVSVSVCARACAYMYSGCPVYTRAAAASSSSSSSRGDERR